MRSNIFLFLAGCLGSGIFNLPYRVGEVGIISYTIFLFAAAVFSFLGMYLVSQIVLEFKVKSYSAMSELAYGSHLKKVAQFCLIGFPWGISTCYQVLISQFFIQLLADNFDLDLYDGENGRETDTYSETGYWVMIAVTVGGIIINLFFILKKELGALLTISIIGVMVVILNVLIIVITFLTGFTLKL